MLTLSLSLFLLQAARVRRPSCSRSTRRPTSSWASRERRACSRQQIVTVRTLCCNLLLLLLLLYVSLFFTDLDRFLLSTDIHIDLCAPNFVPGKKFYERCVHTIAPRLACVCSTAHCLFHLRVRWCLSGRLSDVELLASWSVGIVYPPASTTFSFNKSIISNINNINKSTLIINY